MTKKEWILLTIKRLKDYKNRAMASPDSVRDFYSSHEANRTLSFVGSVIKTKDLHDIIDETHRRILRKEDPVLILSNVIDSLEKTLSEI